MPTTLTALARALDDARPAGAAGDPVLVDAVHDSRAAGPGVLFCAVPGSRTDGHDHAPSAVAAGSPALLVERELDLDVPQLLVPSVRAALGIAAGTVHGDPSHDLAVVGVTGTNGKTTTVALVEAAAAAAGLGTGVVGTTGARVHGAPIDNERTTPEATDLQRLLRMFVDRGVEVAAIEVSSHGLELGRTTGTRFRVAGFTMLGEDHLDFHPDLAAYLAAKQRLFTPAYTDRAVVVVDGDAAGSVDGDAAGSVDGDAAGSVDGDAAGSVDGDAGRIVAAEAVALGLDVVTLATYGREDADVVLEEVDLDVDGGRGVLVGRSDHGRALVGDGVRLRTRLLGRHNLANAALAWALAVTAGVDAHAAAAGIAACPAVAGRLERVGDDDRVVLVDYAHSPDAVRTVVAGLRSLAPPGSRLAVVLGAGGDRDRSKRAPMGAAAAAADLAVITSDNPRSEDPADIVEQVATGAEAAVTAGAPATVVVEVDRRAAIESAVAWARPGDVVLVAGKGHETGQQFADRVEEFDDRVVAAAALAASGGAA